MTPTAPERRPSGLIRAWRGFRRWRRGRPFWGGLWTLLSGIWIFLSTQMDLGNVQIRMGEEGFQSLVIPAVLAIAGLLLWFSPAQRVFYGVIAAIVAVASLVLVNLGGFFIGALLGMVGGALGFAWTPRHPVVDPGAVPDEEPGPDDPLGYPADERGDMARAGGLDVFFPAESGQSGRHRVDDLVDGTGQADEESPARPGVADPEPYAEAESPAEPVESPAEAESPAEPVESPAEPGESSAEPVAQAHDRAVDPEEPRDGHPAAGDPAVTPTRPSYGGPLADTLPTGTVSPLATPRTFPGQFAASLSPVPGEADTAAGARRASIDDPGDATADDPVDAPAGDPADATADESDPTAGEAGQDVGSAGERPSRGGPPVGPVILLVALSVALTGLAVVRFPVAASAAPCPPRARATATPSPRAITPWRTGATPAASPSASATDVGGAVGGALGVLVPDVSGTDATAGASPTASASPADTLAASAEPAATASPSAGTSDPAPTASATAAEPSGTPVTTVRPTAAPAPRASAPAAGSCDRRSAGAPAARTLAADAGQPLVNEQPSLMKAASLTMSGLSYDGVVDLPTSTGTVRALRFSMDKTVSTPFDLLVSQGGRAIDLRSDRLIVSGAVTFYTSRFEAKLDGVVPVTFTPDSPPLVILPDVAFTDATIELVYITGGTLTAGNLDISLA